MAWFQGRDRGANTRTAKARAAALTSRPIMRAPRKVFTGPPRTTAGSASLGWRRPAASGRAVRGRPTALQVASAAWAGLGWPACRALWAKAAERARGRAKASELVWVSLVAWVSAGTSAGAGWVAMAGPEAAPPPAPGP